jgi:hypothetical protein
MECLVINEQIRRGHPTPGDNWPTSEFIDSLYKIFSPRTYGILLKPGGTYQFGHHQNAATFGVSLLDIEEKLDVRIASAPVSDNKLSQLPSYTLQVPANSRTGIIAYFALKTFLKKLLLILAFSRQLMEWLIFG